VQFLSETQCITYSVIYHHIQSIIIIQRDEFLCHPQNLHTSEGYNTI